MLKFLDFINQEEAKLCLILNLIEPKCGGVLLIGKKGTGKSTLIKAFREVVNAFHLPMVEVPMNATEEALLGGIDIESTLKSGEKKFIKGLLSRANGGYLVIEDINLFPQDLLSIIFEVQSKKEILIEREGFSFREPVSFEILATMNLEEGNLSSHFLDRFGMCVFLEDIKDKDKKKQIIKLNLFRFVYSKIEDLTKRIAESKNSLSKINIPDELKEFIVNLVLEEGVEGHRADVYLYYASRAFAAYLGEPFVSKEHILRIAPFVLIHRKKSLPQKREERETQEEKREEREAQEEERKENKQLNGESEQRSSKDNISKEEQPRKGNSGEYINAEFSNYRSLSNFNKEEIFSIGEPFHIKRFILKRDRILRKTIGRRTKTKYKGSAGRFLRSTLKRYPHIAIYDTIKSAAPYQNLRGRRDKLIIYPEDLRYKEKEIKMRHHVIFVVDGSGSMGVAQRMSATKGAILSLLMDCYQRRDKVSMIVFRKDKAEIVLPPTSSVEHAIRRLKEIPTGGKTPLSAGLLKTYYLIKKIKLKEPTSRFLIFIITDGRANLALTEMPVFEELQKICLLLRNIQGIDYIVIDPEKKGNMLTFNLALDLANWLSASYLLIEDLKSETIFNLVNYYKSASAIY